MAVQVVDGLEVVQVHDYHAKALAIRYCGLAGTQLAVQAAAIECAGQRIEQCAQAQRFAGAEAGQHEHAEIQQEPDRDIQVHPGFVGRVLAGEGMQQVAPVQHQQHGTAQHHQPCGHMVGRGIEVAQVADQHQQHQHFGRAHGRTLRIHCAPEPPAHQREPKAQGHQCPFVETQRALAHEQHDGPGQSHQPGASQQAARACDPEGRMPVTQVLQLPGGAIQHGRAQRIRQVGRAPQGDATQTARDVFQVPEQTQQHDRQAAVAE